MERLCLRLTTVPQILGAKSLRSVARFGWLLQRHSSKARYRAAVVSSIIEVTDPRIRVFLGLRDHKRRQELERAGEPFDDIFIAEGDLVIERGLQRGFELRSLLVDAKRTKPLPSLPEHVEVFAASDPVLTEITGRPGLRDPLACFARPELPSLDSIIRDADRVAVLVGLNNPNNLGVIMRNAAGLGVDAVLLDPTCGDPLYRRAIRASMGQVFAIPHTRIGAMPEALDLLHEHGFETVALTPRGDTEIAVFDTPARTAVLLGAEGPGLPDDTIDAATHRVRISMANGVDSLNVANAAAIAFHRLAPPTTT